MVVITRIRGINILNSKIDKNVELDVQGFHLPVKVDEILCYSYIRTCCIYISDVQHLYMGGAGYIDTACPIYRY